MLVGVFIWLTLKREIASPSTRWYTLTNLHSIMSEDRNFTHCLFISSIAKSIYRSSMDIGIVKE